MTKILIAEDDPQIAALLERRLGANGFETASVSDGGAVGEEVFEQAPDLLILDLSLPNREGLEVLRDLRREGSCVPVVILSANQELPVKVAGFELGADDYVTKPFMFDELLVRVKARLRGAGDASRTLAVGGISLDLETRWASYGGKRVELSAREFALLETFMRHPGEVLTREMLLSTVWKFDFDPGSNLVEVYVGYLRRKLGAEVIETVRGAGYRLRVAAS
jgi:two-component system, OmpR family, response regulator